MEPVEEEVQAKVTRPTYYLPSEDAVRDIEAATGSVRVPRYPTEGLTQIFWWPKAKNGKEVLEIANQNAKGLKYAVSGVIGHAPFPVLDPEGRPLTLALAIVSTEPLALVSHPQAKGMDISFDYLDMGGTTRVSANVADLTALKAILVAITVAKVAVAFGGSVFVTLVSPELGLEFGGGSMALAVLAAATGFASPLAWTGELEIVEGIPRLVPVAGVQAKASEVIARGGFLVAPYLPSDMAAVAEAGINYTTPTQASFGVFAGRGSPGVVFIGDFSSLVVLCRSISYSAMGEWQKKFVTPTKGARLTGEQKLVRSVSLEERVGSTDEDLILTAAQSLLPAITDMEALQEKYAVWRNQNFPGSAATILSNMVRIISYWSVDGRFAMYREYLKRLTDPAPKGLGLKMSKILIAFGQVVLGGSPLKDAEGNVLPGKTSEQVLTDTFEKWWGAAESLGKKEPQGGPKPKGTAHQQEAKHLAMGITKSQYRKLKKQGKVQGEGGAAPKKVPQFNPLKGHAASLDLGRVQGFAMSLRKGAPIRTQDTRAVKKFRPEPVRGVPEGIFQNDRLVGNFPPKSVWERWLGPIYGDRLTFNLENEELELIPVEQDPPKDFDDLSRTLYQMILQYCLKKGLGAHELPDLSGMGEGPGDGGPPAWWTPGDEARAQGIMKANIDGLARMMYGYKFSMEMINFYVPSSPLDVPLQEQAHFLAEQVGAHIRSLLGRVRTGLPEAIRMLKFGQLALEDALPFEVDIVEYTQDVMFVTIVGFTKGWNWQQTVNMLRQFSHTLDRTADPFFVRREQRTGVSPA